MTQQYPFQTNLQRYKVAEIEALPFRCGWTAVVYWEGSKQSVACVGAATESEALSKARQSVDWCYAG
jgi:hypothetical protein